MHVKILGTSLSRLRWSSQTDKWRTSVVQFDRIVHHVDVVEVDVTNKILRHVFIFDSLGGRSAAQITGYCRRNSSSPRKT